MPPDTGAQGPKGDTGASGVSKGNVGSITIAAQLTGNAGSSATSNTFGNFSGGSFYIVKYSIYAKSSDPSIDYALTTSLKRSTDAAPITVYYTVQKGVAYRDGVPSIEEVIHAEAIVDGTGVSGTFHLQATTSLGEGIGSARVTLNGFYSQVMVNEIG